LFCPCGAEKLYAAGKCRRCYQRERGTRRHFAGLRPQALFRDHHQCQGCGSHELLIVHHRQPGVSKFSRLLTLCAACHARIERTQFLRRPLSERLRLLWRELHPDAPEQLLLPLWPESLPKQEPLWAA
jgi:5-methylcytosine-specific restriction endonuclease McrA